MVHKSAIKDETPFIGAKKCKTAKLFIFLVQALANTQQWVIKQ
jgi:hypothetical protein